jgi:uncharacterized protein (TIGR02679 family)
MGALDDLRGAGWRRLLAAARRRLQKTGGEPVGAVGLANPSEAEQAVVDEVTNRYRSVSARRPAVQLAELDRALRRGYGLGLLEALAQLDLPDPPMDRKSALEAALRCSHAGEGWFTGWLSEIARDGTVTRLVDRGEGDLIGRAAAVLDRLPARDLPLPVLAEWATGDPTALAGTPLDELVLRALSLWQGAPRHSGREAERRVWNDAGVVFDDLTSQVLVLNLRVAEGHVVAGWLDDAASEGIPFRLTLHQLLTGPIGPDAEQVFVCESPVVLRAAAAELGPDCAPLVCTESRASVACHRLLTAAVAGGARIRWHSDFDWPGIRSTAAAVDRYAADPWRMGADDYLEALAAGTSLPLEGAPTTAPWDERLIEAMVRERRAVREERLLAALLVDLRSGTPVR